MGNKNRTTGQSGCVSLLLVIEIPSTPILKCENSQCEKIKILKVIMDKDQPNLKRQKQQNKNLNLQLRTTEAGK